MTKYWLLLTALSFFLLAAPVKAQSSLPLTIAPARQELLVDPGEKTAITVKFLNQGDSPVSGPLRAVDFVVQDNAGTPTLIDEPFSITGQTQISPRFSAASWVTLPYDQITIAPKNKVLIQATIRVPDDARPGGRYLAIFFEPGGAAEAETTISKQAATPISVRLASLVYIRVTGPVKEDAYVSRLTIPNFSEYGPVKTTAEILNRGDYHIQPIGVIKVTDIFGKVIDRQKLTEQNIFPDTSRSWEVELGQKWLLGRYRAELTASYGETGRALSAVAYFWVIPWKVIIITTLAVIIALLLANRILRKAKKHEEELEDKIEKLEKQLEKETR